MAGLAIITEIRDGKVMSALMMGGGLAGTYLTNKIFNLKKESDNTIPDDDLSLMISPLLQLNRKNNRVVPGFSVLAVF